jgi:Tat protein secretion system quality control protein TatD with DNase activity
MQLTGHACLTWRLRISFDNVQLQNPSLLTTLYDSYYACRSVQDMSEVAPVLDLIRQHAAELVAVGEVGLDFSPHVIGKVHSEEEQRLREVQREVFKQQIQLANELGLPVNVHSRSAGRAFGTAQHKIKHGLVSQCCRQLHVLLHCYCLPWQCS